MLVNYGRNRGVLFIIRTITIPDPTGVMLTGVKLTGVKINIPYTEYDFADNNYTSLQVDLILQTIDAETVTELTWRVIYIQGNNPITDKATYESLIAKGFEIYGETALIIIDPTEIPGCVLWMDFSDTSTMILDTNSNLISMVDKVSNYSIQTTLASSRRLSKIGNGFGYRGTSSYSYTGTTTSPFDVNDYTIFTMYDRIDDSGNDPGENYWAGNFGGVYTSGVYIRSTYLYLYTLGGRIICMPQPFRPMTEPVIIHTKGGATSGRTISYQNNIQTSDLAWSSGLGISDTNYTFGVNRNNRKFTYYQNIIFNRILSDEEVQKVYDWLETKK